MVEGGSLRSENAKTEMVFSTVYQTRSAHPFLGKTHQANIVKLCIARNHNTAGISMWLKKRISMWLRKDLPITVLDVSPGKYSLMTFGRSIITLDDLLSELGLIFEGKYPTKMMGLARKI